MEVNSPTLFVEINELEYIFAVGDEQEQENFKLIYKRIVPILGIESYKIVDFELVFNTIKKNIYLIEQELNYTFKETVLVINNFNFSFINLTGFKKLNGSQILKENITYILNSLKSSIDKTEKEKTIIHIFNSKYYLDKKNVKNLPIGLFGDFYSHELSFSLINDNDYKNLNNIFNKCNLKIKKILLKSFLEGSFISNKSIDTFFYIEINKNNSKIFYFENDALKFEQNFNFGSELLINDISKVTLINKDTVKNILENNVLSKITSNEEIIEKQLFINQNFRKIRKKLILEIGAARIQELAEKILTKNINLISTFEPNKSIFINISDKLNQKCFKSSYFSFFSKEKYFKTEFLENIKTEDLLDNANKLVQYGWKKEVIPVIQGKKSLIARFFDALFS